jgi:hypothetical protein
MARIPINYGTTPGDGTGDILFNSFEKINDNLIELYLPKSGSYNYENSGSKIPFTGTPIKLENDGAGSLTNTTYGLTGISDLFNTQTNQFDFSQLSLGDIVNIRYNYTIITSAVNQESNLFLEIGIGSASPTSRNQHDTFFKVAGSHPTTAVASFLMLGNLSILNFPAEIYFTSETNASVILNDLLISVIKR